jgi:D-beta-D-heptose 7-phosphate kinase/D-beta-D-heptose 1-phosphate adenosyltransferase
MTKVFTNGCFDILHRGHLELFKYAASLGNVLIVGIDSDEKVRLDKGSHRPFNTLEDRIEMLKALRYVNDVYIFENTNDLERLVKQIKPDIMVIGSDWRGKKVIGEQYAKELKFFERLDGYSTTKILENSVNW